MPSPTDAIASSIIAPDNAPTDNDGRRVIGNPNRGCPHCGSVSTKYSGEGKFVVYHPSLECCDRRINEEIVWRRDEIAWIKKKAAEDDAAIHQAQQEAENAEYPSQEKAALKRAEVARNAAAIRYERVHAPAIRELMTEIRRLEGLLGSQRPPVPYKEAP